MTGKSKDKISLGEKRFIVNELEAFAEPGKPRGCVICLRGDWKIVRVARESGYTTAQVAEFLIRTRDYPDSINKEHVYRHWYRCDAKDNNSEDT